MAAEALAVSDLQAAPRELDRGLRRLRRRIRFLLAIRFATLALALLAGAAVPVLVLLKLRAVWFPPLLPEAVLLGGVLLAALVALIWPLPDALVAASADRRFSLRDRTVTALHLVRAAPHTGMEEAAVVDALAHLEALHPKEAFPLRPTRATKVAGLCFALLLGAQFTPLPALLLPPQQREDRALLRREAARIVPVAKKLEEEAKRAGDAQAQQTARRLQQLSKDLERGRLEKKQALLQLDEVNRELEKTAERLAPQPPKTAAEAARQMQESASRSLASRAESLALAVSQRGDKQAEERLRRLAEQARSSTRPEGLKQLAQQLTRAAGAKAGRGLPADLLPSLSLALSNQDWDKVSELLDSLQDLPDDLTPEELAQLRKDLEALAKSLDQSDLAELAKALQQAAGACKSGNCKLSKAALAEGLKLAKSKYGALKLAAACRGAMSGDGLGIGPGDSLAKYNPNAPSAGIYSPRDTKTAGKLAHLPGQIGPGGKMLTITETGAPEKVSASRVPYYEVIGSYSKEAEEALSKEDVPPGYRKAVRQYFDSLQSGTKKP